MSGPGTRILYRDFRLDGRFSLRLTVFHSGAAPFSSPASLADDSPKANEQFRIDLVDPSAPIDSVAKADVLVNVFQTSPSDPVGRRPFPVSVDLSRWAGQTVRLRLAQADNRGPLRVGVDNIRLTRIGSDTDDRVELPPTPRPSRAINLVLHRLSEAGALVALSARAAELARTDQFAGAVLVARHGRVLLEKDLGPCEPKGQNSEHAGHEIPHRLDEQDVHRGRDAAARRGAEARARGRDRQAPARLPEQRRRLEGDGAASPHPHRRHRRHLRARLRPERLKLRTHHDYVKLYGARRLTHEPGERFEYSNYGFVLLGALIEKISGVSYYVRENVFRPAGMLSTDSLPESQHVPNRAVGYTRPYPRGDWQPNTDTLPWRGTAAGGGYSTVGNLMRFAQALSSGKLISTATLAEATRPHRQQYGYGFGVQGQRQLRSYGHGGGAPGQNGELRVFPRLGYVVVSLSNLDPPAASPLVEYFALRMPDR